MPATLEGIRRLQEARQSPSIVVARLRDAGLDAGMAVSGHAASGTTGDFVRVEPLGGGKLRILFGDAEGHDLHAARASLLLHEFFDHPANASLLREPDPYSLLVNLDRAGTPFAEEGKSFSLAVVDLIPREGRFHIVNAGMPLFAAFRRQRDLVRLHAEGMPLGFGEYVSFSDRGVSGVLGSGDILALFTDGVTDAIPSVSRCPKGLTALSLRLTAGNGSLHGIARTLVATLPPGPDDRTLLFLRRF